MFKTMLENSILGIFIKAYETSRTKAAFNTLAVYYLNSCFAKGIQKFADKKDAIKYSFYSRLVNSVNAALTPVFKAIHYFFAVLLKHSRAYNVFLGFANNRTENKLRAVSIFLFYFLLGVSLFSILGTVLRGSAAGFFIASMVFLLLAIFSRQLSGAFYNSFFMKHFKGLIK